MKNSTIERIQQRYLWLKSVYEGDAKLTESQLTKMVDMKTFCSLEINPLFSSISYNTLKNFCLTNSLQNTHYTQPNLWEHMKHLREVIFQTCQNKSPDSKPSDKPTETMKINEAYNQAHLVSIAYLNLFRFFKNVLENDRSLSDATKFQIDNYLNESSLKYENIIAFPIANNRVWSVIQGGKESV